MNAIRNGRLVRIQANDFAQSDLLTHVRDTCGIEKKNLLELELPISVGNDTYSHAVISPRQGRDNIDAFFSGKPLSSAVTWIPTNRFNPNKPFDISWWRGGAAAIADVMLV